MSGWWGWVGFPKRIPRNRVSQGSGVLFLNLGMGLTSGGRFLARSQVSSWYWGSVWFCFDDWVDAGPLCCICHTLFRMVSSNKSPVKKCYVWARDKVSWEVNVRRFTLSVWVARVLSHSLVSFLTCLFAGMKWTVASASLPDQTRIFSTKSFYKALDSFMCLDLHGLKSGWALLIRGFFVDWPQQGR